MKSKKRLICSENMVPVKWIWDTLLDLIPFVCEWHQIAKKKSANQNSKLENLYPMDKKRKFDVHQTFKRRSRFTYVRFTSFSQEICPMDRIYCPRSLKGLYQLKCIEIICLSSVIVWMAIYVFSRRKTLRAK